MHDLIGGHHPIHSVCVGARSLARCICGSPRSLRIWSPASSLSAPMAPDGSSLRSPWRSSPSLASSSCCFMIGLEIDLKKIIRAGRVILLAGAIQLAAGVVLGLMFFNLLGGAMTGFDAVYLSVVCAFEQHGHHRESALRQARARYAAGPDHARVLSAAGHFRDPVSGRFNRASATCRSGSCCSRSRGW